MRRRALAIVLVLAGCTAPHSQASAPPSAPPPTVSANRQPPTPPTPAEPSAEPVRTCAAGPVTVHRQPAHNPGPFGSYLSTGSATVALTFDDGPDPVNTPRLLDVLKACGVKATFCLIGEKVQMYPDVVRRIYDEGHTLCNHTWRHIHQLGSYGRPRITRDLSDTNRAIHAIVPDAPVSYFRAPSGVWTADYIAVAEQLGMTPIHWDVDPSDWQSEVWGSGLAMVDHIVDVLHSTVRPGSIVLSHDYQKPDTTEAYRILLPWLTAQFTIAALPPGGLLPPPPPHRQPLPG